MAQKIHKDVHQLVIRSPAGSDPANFSTTLTYPIRLDRDKDYVLSLHNAILTSSWSTAPSGTAFTFNGNPVVIAEGHYTFDSLGTYLSTYMTIEAIETTGRCKITVDTGNTIVMGSLAPLLGFVEGNILGEGDHIGSYIVAINPVNFISVHCNLVDFNSTRSNVNTSPILRTATLPSCIAPFQYFDLCRETDDYFVKCTNNEISSIDIKVVRDDGQVLGLNPNITTHFTISIKEIEHA